jgi:hypothetical protein
MKKLKGLEWECLWTSHLGCIKGCLNYLGINVSGGWLFGGTGHSFIINIANEKVCPSGPTAWKTEMLFKLGKNLGYENCGVFSFRGQEDFEDCRKEAWELVKKSIDEGIPCYGWELDIPEFYVVNGYDDVGYYFSGPCLEEPEMPKPWEKLGDSDIGVVEMYYVKPAKAVDDEIVVKEAFEFAIKHAENPQEWIFTDKYKSGPAGYDNWINTLKSRDVDGHGMAYNAEVWSECRCFAVEFLKEAKKRLDDELAPLFNDAITHYSSVSDNLKKVVELFPFHERKPEHLEDEESINKAIEALNNAKKSEEKGLETLEKIAGLL